MMKTLNWFKAVFFGVLLVGLYACGDDNVDTVTQRLCAHTWVEEFMENIEGEDVRVSLQLQFALSGNSCKEYLYYRQGETLPYYKETRYFTWRWTDDAQERIEMDFGAGEVGYFDNVQVREHYLSGILDNREVTLRDSSYR